MKQLPKLTLVTKDDQQFEAGGAGAEHYSSGFELVAIHDLAPHERDRIQQRLSEILPKATLIAAARSPRTWDIRPVITRSGENEPSVIRFAGPDILGAPQLSARLRETLERLKSYRDLSSATLGWGSLAGELWFRRPLVESTLAHILSGTPGLTLPQTLQAARSLCEEVSKWHERGVVHAHITSSNIVLRQNGRGALLDAGIGLATLQASKLTLDYNLQSFAPELVSGQAVMFRSDLYGLGLVFRRLFAAVSASFQFDKKREQVDRILGPLVDLSSALLEADPNRRPPLSDIKRTIADAIQKTNDHEERRKTRIRPGAIQGRILRPGRPDLAQAEDETPAPVEPAEPAAPKPSRKEQRKEKAQRPAERATVADNDFGANLLKPAGDEDAAPAPLHASAAPQQAFTGGPHVQTNIYQAMQGQHVQPPPHAAHPPQPHPYNPAQHPGHLPGHHAAHHGQMPQQPIMHGYPPAGPMPQMYAQQPGYAHPNPYGYAQQPMYAPPPQQQMPSGTYAAPAADTSYLRWFVFFGALLAAFWYYRVNGFDRLPFVGQHYNIDQLREDWTSRIPSRMLPVALAAIDKDHPSSAAESVILSSVRAGDLSSAGVNVSLLRVAFDDRWEVDLTEEDRRVALALGLGALLKQHVPRDLASLDELHPGVLLALVSSIGRNAGKNLFAAVPANRLVELPPPLGPAFRQLTDGKQALTAGDEQVQRLARLATRGVELEEVALFLREDTRLRLRVLAALYSQDNSQAQTLLEILLKDPNAIVNDDSVRWGRAFQLLQWEELEPSDRLFVLAGTVPSRAVSPENIGKLFAHPEPALRSFGIKSAIGSIRMGHPGAVEVLHIIETDPKLLSSEQTIELMKLLINPAAQDVNGIRAWLESNPPLQIVVPLLLATAEGKKGTLLDTSLAVYLKGKNWKPGVDVLRKLSMHPDGYTRLFAYGEIYLMHDRETAREFLSSALKREVDEENRQQLNQMLLDLTN